MHVHVVLLVLMGKLLQQSWIMTLGYGCAKKG